MRTTHFRAAIFSDVHANLPALLKVLAEIKCFGVDVIYCLGDVVGYGGFPSECIALMREKVNIILQGNHDYSVATLETDPAVLRNYNVPAALASTVHAKLLTKEEKEYLGSLRTDIAFGVLNLGLAHGNFSNPLSWRYTFTRGEVESHPGVYACVDDEYQYCPTLIGAIGHTHGPRIYAARDGLLNISCTQNPVELPLGEQKFIVNVGSVGQPRDHDPRACWTLWEFHKNRTIVEFRRVAYNIAENADMMQKIGIEEVLQCRLYRGN